MIRYTLHLSGRQHRALSAHLFPGDGLEAATLVLCGRRWGQDSHGLFAKQLVPIPHRACTVRTENRLEWPTRELLLPFVEIIEKEQLGFVVIHSHPTGFPRFSETDDTSDRRLFGSVYGWFDDNGCHGSAVMLPDGQVFGRVVTEDGRFEPLAAIHLTGDDIRIHRQMAANSDIPEFGERVAQAFGEGTFQTLRSMKAAVVGCSGTGSIVVEQLTRNGVGKLVLVDPDVVESKNLNRIPQATQEDATKKRLKVEVIARWLEEIGLGTEVEQFPTDISNQAAMSAVASCDVIFGCVDSVEGRHHLNLLASAYLLPYFDIGVHLQPDGQGSVSHAVAAVNYLQPGGSSLLSRGVYRPDQLASASYQRTVPEYYRQTAAEGYLPGLPDSQPAVISLNSLAASMAVNDLLARIHAFRLDPNGDFARQTFYLAQGYYKVEGDGEPCPFFKKWVGYGDTVQEFIRDQVGTRVA